MPARPSRSALLSLAAAAVGTALTLSPLGQSAPALAPGAGTAAPASAAQVASAPTAGSALTADLDRLLTDPRLQGSQVGLEVRDAATGEVLYDHGAGTRLLPASNTKLLTSVAALQVLGPDHRFRTTVATSGTRTGPVLHGDLVLRGTGDPTMLAADYDALAGQVAATGITHVTGRLVADDTYFDDVRLAPFWSWDDEPYYYSGQVSALTVAPDTDYDAGSVIVHVAPGAAAGDPAVVTTEPPTSYVHVVDRATTGAAGSDDTADAVREHGSNTVEVTGSVPADGSPDDIWSTVWEPTGLAASILRDALARHGVSVGGWVRGASPEGADVVATHDSMPLSQMLVPFLKLSNNMHAEHLVKAMGAKVSGQGTWSAGIAAEKAALAHLGVDTSAVRLADGSGLSRADMVAPHQLTNLLVAARGEPWFRTWYDALPVAGEADRMVGGTLRSRMRGTPAAGNVHAKTGSMTGVSGLSGYVTDGSGRPLVFSMVTNNYVASSVRTLEDAVAVRLASEGATSTRSLRMVAPAEPAPRTADERRADELECSWVKHAC